ncbi:MULTISPECIES: polysaccharide biosynthesis/export family protein [unclassified Sulfuricurvum]|uniref:polysaccharide biosynthesis/export family protein n=1 Tax=unclassified Sulfuricurvum TaxID=2632390 RepID=UPI0025BD929C|nr:MULTISPECIES: polysaccharide biosynthesis/export family protein [unclassified Sulfuricurvum]
MLLLSGCATKQDMSLFQENSVKTQPVYQQPVQIEYKISPRDKLSVQVFNHPELTTRAEAGLSVSADGTVMLALLGRVKMSGLTKEEASELLREKYAKYLKEPQVTVELVNQRIYVMGEVNRPGIVPLTNDTMSLIEAIAQAGDFNVYGERTSVKILRGDHNNPTISTVDMTNLASLNTSDLILHQGNVVYVEPNTMRVTNVNVNEYLPVLQLINSLISPFVSIQYLTK